ncbi:protein FAM78B-like [Ptychodera flava]|uniref:protein FAM78B-like n=1 Tax=Ptychodera flava TaxID=63121 RepID=UPI00396A7334
MLLYLADFIDAFPFPSLLSQLVAIPDHLLGKTYLHTMGCVLAKRRRKTNTWENAIQVYELNVAIDRTPTLLDENSPTVLRYKTPYFRASAKVRFPPLRCSEEWQVGWVQVCTHMEFKNTYGHHGYACWEIPSLQVKRADACVSDSDGKNYPWYGATTEVATIEGPTSRYSDLFLRMNDNFHPSITWDLPVKNTNDAKLTKVTRNQSFTVWLVAINKTTKRTVVLKTIQWKMQLDIAVDPKRKLGKRAELIGPVEQQQPIVLRNADSYLPDEAFHPPNANEAQKLVWYPSGDAAVCVVPPKYKPHANGTR